MSDGHHCSLHSKHDKRRFLAGINSENASDTNPKILWHIPLSLTTKREAELNSLSHRLSQLPNQQAIPKERNISKKLNISTSSPPLSSSSSSPHHHHHHDRSSFIIDSSWLFDVISHVAFLRCTLKSARKRSSHATLWASR